MEDYKMFDHLKEVKVEKLFTTFYFKVDIKCDDFLEDPQIKALIEDRGCYVAPTGDGIILHLNKRVLTFFESA